MKLLAFILLASVWMGCQQTNPPYTTIKNTVYNLPDTLGLYVKRHFEHGHNDTVNHVFYVVDSVYYERLSAYPIYLDGGGEGFISDSGHSRIYEEMIDKALRKQKRIHTDTQSVNIGGDNNGEIIQLR